jgi:preprotein translocase subunit SecG
MYFVLITLYVFVCFLLLVVVLLQQGKGGDIAAAFGGSSSQTAFGARAGATVLTRATAVLGTLFMLGAFLLGVTGRSGSDSVLSGVQGPGPATPKLPDLPPVGGSPTPTPPAVSPSPTPSSTPAADPKKPAGRGGGNQA